MSAESFPRSIALRAGPIDLEFEPATMFARSIRVGHHELVRAIYSAIRDDHWGTYGQQLEVLETQIQSDSFKVVWLSSTPVCECLGELIGARDGTLSFEVRITALESFCTNRSGICVLHPANECRGLECTIDHGNSQLEHARFPDAISPHQPFFNVHGIEHAGPGQSRVRLTFEGEVFETEDQRNWTDASFKTYCRPLSMPAPFVVQAGSQIEQSVSLVYTQEGIAPSTRRPKTGSNPGYATLTVGPRLDRQVPKLGTMLGEQSKLSSAQADRLKAIGLSHLGVRVNLENSAEFGKVSEAWAIGLPIELHLQSYDRAARELNELLRALKGVDIARVLLVSDAPSGDFRGLVESIQNSLGTAVPVFAAAGSNFTELNRSWPDLDKLAGVGFAVNPQVHAFDDMSVMETTEMHAVVAEQAKLQSEGKLVSVAPVTLEPRSWADRPADARLHTNFGAAWLMASVRSLANGSADFATYFETHGPRGILEAAGDQPGQLERALRQLAEWQGAIMRWNESDLPSQAQAFCVDVGQSVASAILNLTEAPIRIRFQAKDLELNPYEWTLHFEGGS